MAAKSAGRKRLEGLLGRWALRGAWALFRLMPLRAAQRLGAGLGQLAYALSRRYRRVAIENLRRAFPDWTPQQVKTTAQRVFRNFGVSLAEFLKAPSMTQPRLSAS
jgi:lauroyl/myristoyl acyltransferase